MITFILHGGAYEKTSEQNRALISASLMGRRVGILSYARESALWLEDGKRQMHRHGLTPDSVVLTSRPMEEMLQDLEGCDAFLISGGSEPLLKRELEPCLGRFLSIADGKVVVASSAGANIWSHLYYSNDRKTVETGFGILNIATVCHFDGQTDALERLVAGGVLPMPLIALPEGESVSLQYGA